MAWRLTSCCGIVLAIGSFFGLPAAGGGDEPSSWPLVTREDFESGAGHWRPTDPSGWRVEAVDGNRIFRQFKKENSYVPPHRSPLNIAILQDVVLGDFVATARVRSTHPDYAHRDVCFVFGYQNPAHFYYVHLGKTTDEHANQIFAVDDADRKKISDKTTSGTPWDDNWHTLRVVRRVADGTIEVFFDDMQQPVMTAKDSRFRWGQIGVGSFDDTSDWDAIELRGQKVDRPAGS